MNILIVDDDVVDRESIKRSLRHDDDYVIQEVETVDDGLDIIKITSFDLVLLDYNLPQRNGIELLLELKSGASDSSSTTFIMMSTDEADERALECIHAGAQDFLMKQEITPFRLKRAIMNARTRFELEQKLLNSYIETKELAERDSLTGLANRYFFDESLKLAIANQRRNKNVIALLLIDLDHFKYVNDSYGHDVGDQLLIEVVKRISNLLRKNELFARLGGDEFVLTLTNLLSIRGASDIASRLIEAFKQPFIIDGIVLNIGLSIGISICPSDSQNAKELFKYADIAMYRAKKMGRNQFSFFEQNMQKQSLSVYKMESALRGALEKELFTLNYQPIFDSEKKQLVGAEALIRWQHEGQMISPDTFIPVAEKSMAIVGIGRWVLNKSISQLAEWNKLLDTPIGMSINLSTVQLSDEHLLNDIIDCLESYHVAPELVTLEITETALLAKSDQAPFVLKQISELGCKIALDDFGTGFSSLSHLINFPLDIVKIDKSLMPTVSKGQKEAHIMTGLVSMVKSLELEIVGEGIEEQIDLDLCCKLKVDKLQGYYFDKPLSEQAFITKYIT